MSSTVSIRESRRPDRRSPIAIGRKLARLLAWRFGAVAAALIVAGCGGGAAAPSVTTSVPPDQVAAFALTQQSVAARTVALQSVAPAGVPARAAADNSGNLISNGGFEDGMAGWVNWGNASVVAGQASSGTSAPRH